MKKIVIVSTATYNGGVVVLLLLCKMLCERGFDAKVFFLNYCPNSNKNLKYVKFLLKSLKLGLRVLFRDIGEKIGLLKPNELFIKCKHKYLPWVSDDTIVLYPELVYGNPLRAKNVVRWFLFHNRFPDSPDAYGKNELVFSFREYFNDYNLNPSCRLLNLNYFNKNLYKQTNFGERQGVCYIIRKGKNRPDLPKTFDGPVIDNLSEKEKVAVFNKCKFCYDYDTQTFYASIAVVCGCVPIVVMEPGKTKEDYLGIGDKDWGKAYGETPEEIEYAVKTRPLRLKMLNFDEQNRKSVDFFLSEIHKHFDR